MAFPPTPPPLTTHPAGKPGIPDLLVENARRAMELARAEAELSLRMERVVRRMMVHQRSSGPRGARLETSANLTVEEGYLAR